MIRVIAGLIISASGIFATYAIYSLAETGSVTVSRFVWAISAMALITLVIAVAALLRSKGAMKSVVPTILMSYAAYGVMYFAVSLIEGVLAEAIMWALVAAMFGAVFTLPLILGVWFGARTALGLPRPEGLAGA